MQGRTAAALVAALAHASAGAAALTLRWDVLHADHVETFAGGLNANREQGPLRGPGLQLAADAGAWRWSAEAQALSGDLRYDGLNQFGLPLATRTDLAWRRAAVAVGPAAFEAGGVHWSPTLQVGELRQRRAIQASAASLPATETLSQRFAGPALQARGAAGALQLSAVLRAEWPLRQRLDVDTFGVLDRYALQPGDREALGVELLAAFDTGFGRLALGLAGERRRFGAAPAQAVARGGEAAGSAAYPGSRQWHRGAVLTFAWSL